jgi:SAM-dependent methyltransferase
VKVTEASYWSCLDRHTVWDDIWMSPPSVRARINRRVTGDSSLWPIAWLPSVVPDRVPFARVLSIGCGVGNFERSLVELGIVGTVTGIDASAEVIVGAADRIQYVAADARETLKNARDLDAIFFHASLHHFDRLPELLGLVRRALQPRGILYLDEYVGPARHEWTWAHLLKWNAVYRTLPAAVRRTHIVRRPINREDPTEAIASSGILPAVAEHFRVIARRDYGGDLLTVIYPSLLRPDQPNGPSPKLFEEVIESLLDREERLLARGHGSFQAVVVAEPLESAES